MFDRSRIEAIIHGDPLLLLVGKAASGARDLSIALCLGVSLLADDAVIRLTPFLLVQGFLFQLAGIYVRSSRPMGNERFGYLRWSLAAGVLALGLSLVLDAKALATGSHIVTTISVLAATALSGAQALSYGKSMIGGSLGVRATLPFFSSLLFAMGMLVARGGPFAFVALAVGAMVDTGMALRRMPPSGRPANGPYDQMGRQLVVVTVVFQYIALFADRVALRSFADGSLTAVSVVARMLALPISILTVRRLTTAVSSSQPRYSGMGTGVVVAAWLTIALCLPAVFRQTLSTFVLSCYATLVLFVVGLASLRLTPAAGNLVSNGLVRRVLLGVSVSTFVNLAGDAAAVYFERSLLVPLGSLVAALCCSWCYRAKLARQDLDEDTS